MAAQNLVVLIMFSRHPVDLKKKKAQCENCELSSTGGQKKDCSPGVSMSESSEKLLQRGSGERSVYKVLVKEEFIAIEHLSEELTLLAPLC